MVKLCLCLCAMCHIEIKWVLPGVSKTFSQGRGINNINSGNILEVWHYWKGGERGKR